MNPEVERRYAQARAALGDLHEHLPTLCRYASQCTHVTEMGVWRVCSSWALLAAGPKRMISYDVIRHVEVDDLERLGKTVCDFEFRQQNVLDVDIEETDLLFIDSLHTYTQLSAELAKHSPHVRKWIILHDTVTFGAHGQDESVPGLWAAVEKFVADSGGVWRIAEHFTNNNGLTVLSR